MLFAQPKYTKANAHTVRLNPQVSAWVLMQNTYTEAPISFVFVFNSNKVLHGRYRQYDSFAANLVDCSGLDYKTDNTILHKPWLKILRKDTGRFILMTSFSIICKKRR